MLLKINVFVLFAVILILSLSKKNSRLVFLNLPIWALFYSLNLNLNQLNRLRTRLDKQSGLSTELDWLRLRQVEVEAQPTRLI